MSNHVKIDSVIYDVLAVRKNPRKYFFALDAARASNAKTYCACKKGGNLRISIRKSKNGDKYFFALWPNEGDKHDASCIFYDDAYTRRGVENFSLSSITEDAENNSRIKQDFAFVIKTAQVENIDSFDKKPRGKKTQRRSAGLVAILRHLWEKSRNHIWFGYDTGTRSNTRALGFVADTLEYVRFGSYSASDVLYVNPVQDITGFRRSLEGDINEVRQGLFLSEIDAMVATSNGYRINCAPNNVSLFLSNQLQQSIEGRFGRELDLKRKYGDKVRLIALARVRQKKSAAGHSYFTAVDVGLMAVSSNYLPVDSGYELEVADELCAKKRRFQKPMSVEEDLLPDFVLLDCYPVCYMEVFGMNTPAYLRRKDEKLHEYSARGKRLWTWDAYRSPSAYQTSIPAPESY